MTSSRGNSGKPMTILSAVTELSRRVQAAFEPPRDPIAEFSNRMDAFSEAIGALAKPMFASAKVPEPSAKAVFESVSATPSRDSDTKQTFEFPRPPDPGRMIELEHRFDQARLEAAAEMGARMALQSVQTERETRYQGGAKSKGAPPLKAFIGANGERCARDSGINRDAPRTDDTRILAENLRQLFSRVYRAAKPPKFSSFEREARDWLAEWRQRAR